MPTVINGTTGITFTDNTIQNTAAINFRNRIINGGMVIDQRNAGASVTQTTGSLYPVDRFYITGTPTSKFTAQQNAGSVTPPAGYTNYLGITSSSAYSVGAGDFFTVAQVIEGFNIADLNWGSASAQTVTLSFWVRSSLTGSFGGALENSAANRCYPFAYTISSANTWEQKSITITGDTTGTWLTNNSAGVTIRWGLGVGSTFGSGTAGAWSATRSFAPTGSVSVVGTNGATFYITGVQLERGSTASSFDFRSYGQELALCQRYYQEVGSAAANELVWSFYSQASGTTYYLPMSLPVPMRAAPTGTVAGTWNLSNISSLTVTASYNAFRFNATTSVTNASATFQNNGTGAKLTFAIEL
jgi:hypothetical protein